MRTSFLGIVLLAVALVMSMITPPDIVWTFVEVVIVFVSGILMLHDIDRSYFQRQRQKTPISTETLGYMSEHLISNMRESGMTDGQISRKIVDTILKKL